LAEYTLKIKEMTLADLDQVMIIEQESFRIPWERSYFEYDLKRPGGYCYVAKEDGKTLGYVDAWHIADEMHLANIAVTESHRHKGIGSQLLSKIIQVARKNKCIEIFLEVRASNLIAQKFYEKFGFTAIYTRKKYYPDGEDAIVYQKQLN
jgi:ribosomal-protein-alanine N-acetyltransferase